MNTMRKNLFAVLMILFAFAVTLNLSSCSSAPSKCTGEITYQGKTYTGIDKTAGNAKRNACNKYCLDKDPMCDAMYGIWVTSPRGKAAGRLPKQKAIYEDQKLMDCVTITCANRCLEEIKEGKAPSKGEL